MSDIAALKLKVNETKAAYDAVRAELLAAQLAEFPVQIGDIVLCKGKEYKVARIETEYKWVSGYMRRKDGTFGTMVRHLYTSWTKKETK